MKYLNDLDWLHLVRFIEFEKIQEVLPKSSNKKVLEIGSGTGFMFGKLNQMYENVSGLEVEGSSYNFNNKNIKLYDGKNIPFKDNSFDIIVSSHVLEHVNEIDYLINEINRVMKKDAVAIHVIPSSTWRVLTSMFHYFALVRFFINFFTKKGRLSIQNKSNKRILKDKLKFVIFSPRHGERGNVFSEVYFFSKFFWKKKFLSQNSKIISVISINFTYWGNDILRNFLPIILRKKIPLLIGSS